MPIDPSATGRVYPTQAYEVSRERIREFADAVGDANPVHRDTEAAKALGHAEVIAPPTFAMIPVLRGFDVLMDDLGIVYARVIHANQRFVHLRPIRAGDQLRTTTTLDTVRSVGGNDLLGIRCEVESSTGERICTATATLLIREVGGDGA
ncbi:MAG TPA: MaoC family dehydratase N-terminal domain-containing protein [Jiangellaceae bacterium]|nr:MaoC family dehydratase N-terminal domain-containing protein [Jiangellaceae bacterium]